MDELALVGIVSASVVAVGGHKRKNCLRDVKRRAPARTSLDG